MLKSLITNPSFHGHLLHLILTSDSQLDSEYSTGVTLQDQQKIPLQYVCMKGYSKIKLN